MKPTVVLSLALIALPSLACSGEAQRSDCAGCGPNSERPSTFVTEEGEQLMGGPASLELFFGTNREARLAATMFSSDRQQSWTFMMGMEIEDVFQHGAGADVGQVHMEPGRAWVEYHDGDEVVPGTEGRVVADIGGGSTSGTARTQDPRTSGDFYAPLALRCWVPPEAIGQEGGMVDNGEVLALDELRETEECRTVAADLKLPPVERTDR